MVLHRAARRRTLFVAAVASAALACGDATGPASPVGNYALSTVNGRPIPARLFADSGFTVDVTGGTLAVEEGGRFVVGLASRWVVDGNAADYVVADTGRWAVTGERLVLTYADSSTRTALWQSKRVTVADSSRTDLGGPDVTTFVFARP